MQELTQQAKVLGEMRQRLPRRHQDSLLFYEAKCQSYTGNHENAVSGMAKALEKGWDAPEVLSALMDLARDRVSGSGNRLPVRRMESEIGRILPLSEHGRTRNGLLQSAYGERRTRRSISGMPLPVPNIDQPEILLKIGGLYEQEGMRTEAVDAYLSAIHVWPSDREDADLWLRIAGLELESGHPELALRAFLRAAWVDDNHLDDCAHGVSGCLHWKGPHRGAQTGRMDSEVRLKVARLYGEYRAHPVAFHVLTRAQNPNDQGVTVTRRALQESWDKIVTEMFRRHGENVFLYGYRAKEVTDWAEVVILRPHDTFWRPAAGRE